MIMLVKEACGCQNGFLYPSLNIKMILPLLPPLLLIIMVNGDAEDAGDAKDDKVDVTPTELVGGEL